MIIENFWEMHDAKSRETTTDMDGWEVCRRLKGDARTQRIPIVILTARDEPHGIRRAAEAGCAAYLKKPCAPGDLVAVIKKILHEQQAV